VMSCEMPPARSFSLRPQYATESLCFENRASASKTLLECSVIFSRLQAYLSQFATIYF
jgi:hypothetical protein